MTYVSTFMVSFAVLAADPSVESCLAPDRLVVHNLSQTFPHPLLAIVIAFHKHLTTAAAVVKWQERWQCKLKVARVLLRLVSNTEINVQIAR